MSAAYVQQQPPVAPSNAPPLLPTPPPQASLSNIHQQSTTATVKSQIGIIYPPADIRGIIDKTAAFVAKNGIEFEQRVIREQSNQRFAFLQMDNPYRPYYELKVLEFKTGEVTKYEPAVPQAIVDMRKKEEAKSKKKEQILMLTDFGSPKNSINASDEDLEPTKDIFSLKHPYIATIDSDIIKLSAQFVARNGPKFLLGLTTRERNNPQFEFLKPTHTLFSYFTDLVEVYSKCLIPENTHIDKLKKNIADDGKWIILKSGQIRFESDAKKEKDKKKKEEVEEAERVQMQSIDWHDFVVVETIDFTAEDEKLPLRAPVDLQSRSTVSRPGSTPSAPVLPLVEQSQIQKKVQLFESDTHEDDDEEMEIDEGDTSEHFATDSITHMNKDAEMMSELSEVSRSVDDISHPQFVSSREDAVMAETEGEIVIRHDYVRQKRRPGGATATMSAAPMLKCPLTGQLIYSDQMTQHLKILLLDPKWKEQKDKLLDRAKKEQAFAPETDVETNLAQFVSRRPDLFGTVEDEIQESIVDTRGIDITLTYDPTVKPQVTKIGGPSPAQKARMSAEARTMATQQSTPQLPVMGQPPSVMVMPLRNPAPVNTPNMSNAPMSMIVPGQMPHPPHAGLLQTTPTMTPMAHGMTHGMRPAMGHNPPLIPTPDPSQSGVLPLPDAKRMKSSTAPQ